MLLAIDVGNTNTKFALYDGEREKAAWRIQTARERTADEYAVWLTQLMHLQGLAPSVVTAAIIATVVPPTLLHLRRLCQVYFKCEPLVVGDANCRLGIEIRYNRPQDVGADRLVDAIGAHAMFPGALIVIDFGTATTFNVVAANGDYLGGVIAPGVNVNLEALHLAAAKLPRIDFSRPSQVIGADTRTAMQSGTYWGYVGMIEGLCQRIRAEHGGVMTVVATGGLATLFAGGTEVIQHVVPDLTMRGFVEILRRNRAG